MLLMSSSYCTSIEDGRTEGRRLRVHRLVDALRRRVLLHAPIFAGKEEADELLSREWVDEVERCEGRTLPKHEIPVPLAPREIAVVRSVRSLHA
jgi:hypothetical protein